MISRIPYFQKKNNPSRQQRPTVPSGVACRLFLVVLSATFLVPAQGADWQNKNYTLLPVQQSAWLRLQCHRRELRLHCSYRLLPRRSGIPASVTPLVRIGRQTLPLEVHQPYPRRGDKTAILFLVDTSDPRRANVVQRNAAQIRALLENALPHHTFGLAAFDKDLRILSEVGGDTRKTAQATHKLYAVGKHTELYRCTLDAVRLLSDQPATRRALFLFSDGLAEDTAYFNEDVVRVARDADVSVHSLGFARTPGQHTGLQSLRRLSEETGGLFVEATPDLKLPPHFLQNPFATIESGGFFRIDATDKIPQPVAGTQIRLRLRFLRGEEPLPGEFLVALGEAQGAPDTTVPSPRPGTVPLRPAPAPLPAQPPPPTPWFLSLQIWPQIWLQPWLIIAALLAAFPLLRALRRRRGETATYTPMRKPARIYSYLLPDSNNLQTKNPIPIDCVPFRIGRANTNDLVLPDASVSRHHAEVDYEKGQLLIRDLASLNGLLVNGERVKDCSLQENDLLGIGEYSLCVKMDSPQESDKEKTLFMQTLRPNN